MNAVMPRASPSSPEVRAKITSSVAECMPELNGFAPLRIQSSPSRTPVDSIQVASLPCSGSVSPKPMRLSLADRLGQPVALPAGLVGAPGHLVEQLLPLRSGCATGLEVGARPLAAVVEEPFVVVAALQRPDFPLDELVELGKALGQLGRQFEVHEPSSTIVQRG
jgi:hypothetical protein